MIHPNLTGPSTQHSDVCNNSIYSSLLFSDFYPYKIHTSLHTLNLVLMGFVCLNLLNIYLAALVGILNLHCSMQVGSFLWHVGSSSQAKDRIQPLCIGSRESQPLDHQVSPLFMVLKRPFWKAAFVCRDRGVWRKRDHVGSYYPTVESWGWGWRLGLRAANLGRKGQIQDMLSCQNLEYAE